MPQMFKCMECGKPFEAKRVTAKYCGNVCKSQFHNRMRIRGAELYSFFMMHRFERGEHESECRAIMAALASSYREADNQLREGRKSWLPMDAAQATLGRLPGVQDGR